MVFQAFAVDTLLPPNFMTTQGEPDISRLDPSSLPSAKGASSISMLTTVTCLFRLFIFHINRPIHFAGKKKTRLENPCGSAAGSTYSCD
jgi:hypothetical protein